MSALERYYEVPYIIIKDRREDQKVLYKNFLVDHPIIIGAGSSNFIAGDISTWMKCVEEMARWYVSTGTHYSNTEYIGPCPLIGKGVKVRPDCSGFVSACVSAFLKKPAYLGWNTALMIPGTPGYRDLVDNGWSHKRLSSEEDKMMADPSKRWEILQPGDIVRHSTVGYGGPNNGHTYVIGPNRQRFEMGGKNGRKVSCSIPYNDYVDRGAANGHHHSYDIFRRK